LVEAGIGSLLARPGGPASRSAGRVGHPNDPTVKPFQLLQGIFVAKDPKDGAGTLPFTALLAIREDPSFSQALQDAPPLRQNGSAPNSVIVRDRSLVDGKRESKGSSKPPCEDSRK
jgi:hypothetical protein